MEEVLKKATILIQDELVGDGDKPRYYGFVVWANKGKKQVLETVPGVHRVIVDTGSDIGNSARYSIILDPRYDRLQVRAKIEEKLGG